MLALRLKATETLILISCNFFKDGHLTMTSKRPSYVFPFLNPLSLVSKELLQNFNHVFLDFYWAQNSVLFSQIQTYCQTPDNQPRFRRQLVQSQQCSQIINLKTVSILVNSFLVFFLHSPLLLPHCFEKVKG